jgi:hypothetical protein
MHLHEAFNLSEKNKKAKTDERPANILNGKSRSKTVKRMVSKYRLLVIPLRKLGKCSDISPARFMLYPLHIIFGLEGIEDVALHVGQTRITLFTNVPSLLSLNT